MMETGTEAPVQPRLVRCPRCRLQFETLRRFRMACTECGYEWEEASVLTWYDKVESLKSEWFSYVFVGLGWLALAFFPILLIMAFIGMAGGSIAGGLAVAVVMLPILLVVALRMRPSMEASARLQWWVPNWRGPRDRGGR